MIACLTTDNIQERLEESVLCEWNDLERIDYEEGMWPPRYVRANIRMFVAIERHWEGMTKPKSN